MRRHRKVVVDRLHFISFKVRRSTNFKTTTAKSSIAFIFYMYNGMNKLSTTRWKKFKQVAGEVVFT